MFSNDAATIPSNANRHLLLELCLAQGLTIANTFTNVADEKLITCYNVGKKAMDTVTWEAHSQIDFVLCSRLWLPSVKHAASNRGLPLASHHFALEITLEIVVPKQPRRATPLAPDVRSLSCAFTASRFAALFDSEVEAVAEDETDDVNLLYARIVDAFDSAAGHALPQPSAQRRRPWISSQTLDLIEDRCRARREHDLDQEKALTAYIRRSVKTDRAEWLERKLASADWSEVRKLRKGHQPKQGRLKNSTGEMQSSEARAETLAEHLEHVQWAVRPLTTSDASTNDRQALEVNLGEISEKEVVSAGWKLKNNRASGLDKIPGEYWKTVLMPGSAGARYITKFCQLCWSSTCVPDDWHKAQVAMVFKKGDPSLCDNYRPISLLAIGYKLFAAVLLDRLRNAGAEEQLWPTQFGFRRERGTNDALFVARRCLERAWSAKDGKIVFLALDWAKAFDSVSPAMLAVALKRFGIPKKFIDMVQAIYCHRRFIVKDASSRSDWHEQRFGISQGCPLSPFLFVVLMTVLLEDAKSDLASQGIILGRECLVNELVYADDTLIVDTDPTAAEHFMNAVGRAGGQYGLSFNWSKLEALPVCMDAMVHKPDMSLVLTKTNIIYLGSALSADGRIAAELGRRIGMAKADFNTLQKVWAHSTLSQRAKIRIFDACVVSKLTYGLQTACLSKAERRRLDGFHCRCLRRILRIPHAYVSRVSNNTVFERAHRKPLSTRLLQAQLLFLGQLARREGDDPVRRCIFQGGGFQMLPSLTRKRGRPRATWIDETMKAANVIAGSAEKLSDYFAPSAQACRAWKGAVSRYCNSL